MLTIELPGRINSKKNSKRIFAKGSKVVVIPSAAYADWHRRMIPIVRTVATAAGLTAPIETPINLAVVVFSASTDFDLSNQIQSVEDLLQDAGTVADDQQVHALDGSAKVHLCPSCRHRGTYAKGPQKGQRKPSCGAVSRCPYECAVVTITPYHESARVREMARRLYDI